MIYNLKSRSSFHIMEVQHCKGKSTCAFLFFYRKALATWGNLIVSEIAVETFLCFSTVLVSNDFKLPKKLMKIPEVQANSHGTSLWDVFKNIEV